MSLVRHRKPRDVYRNINGERIRGEWHSDTYFTPVGNNNCFSVTLGAQLFEVVYG
jgi:hypothetical protein